MKTWHRYVITLRSDGGKLTEFSIPDTRLTNAIRRILHIERAPFRSLVSARRLQRSA